MTAVAANDNEDLVASKSPANTEDHITQQKHQSSTTQVQSEKASQEQTTVKLEPCEHEPKQEVRPHAKIAKPDLQEKITTSAKSSMLECDFDFTTRQAVLGGLRTNVFVQQNPGAGSLLALQMTKKLV